MCCNFLAAKDPPHTICCILVSSFLLPQTYTHTYTHEKGAQVHPHAVASKLQVILCASCPTLWRCAAKAAITTIAAAAAVAVAATQYSLSLIYAICAFPFPPLPVKLSTGAHTRVSSSCNFTYDVVACYFWKQQQLQIHMQQQQSVLVQHVATVLQCCKLVNRFGERVIKLCQDGGMACIGGRVGDLLRRQP